MVALSDLDLRQVPLYRQFSVNRVWHVRRRRARGGGIVKDIASSVSPEAEAVFRPREFSASDEFCALILGKSGRIESVNDAAAALFGYSAKELEGSHVSQVLPRLTETEISRDPQLSHVRYLSHCGMRFTGVRRDGGAFPCGLSIVLCSEGGETRIRLIVGEAKEGATPCL